VISDEPAAASNSDVTEHRLNERQILDELLARC
jgi:hypothetical protein